MNGLPCWRAARWATSSYNSQPWRFVYARRDHSQFDPLMGLLSEENQLWAKEASSLVIVVSCAYRGMTRMCHLIVTP